jgi:hypothetical protein
MHSLNIGDIRECSCLVFREMSCESRGAVGHTLATCEGACSGCMLLFALQSEWRRNGTKRRKWIAISRIKKMARQIPLPANQRLA